MPLAFFLLASQALNSQSPAPELLRVKPVVDHRIEYRMEFTIDMAEGDQKDRVVANFLLAERVLRVDGDRITLRRFAVPKSVVGTGKGGEEMARLYRAAARGTYIMVTDHRSHTLSIGDGRNSVAGNTIDVALPEAPVSPGSSWEGMYGANGEVKLRYTLRGIAAVGDRRVALIDLTQPEVLPNGFLLESESRFALDLADGRWLRSRAGISAKAEGRDLNVHYEISRTGAPGWSTILAAFPEKG